MLKVALIGFGGITKVHRSAYRELEKRGIARLVCAYDVNADAFASNVKINIDDGSPNAEEEVKCYTDLEEMLSREEIDFVDVCTPTYTHCNISIDMLKRGYHVMCEKPMSLTYSECKRMVDTAREFSRELMIGQCVRFMESYEYVKSAVVDKRFGEVKGAFFERLSMPPTWGWENWFMNPERSGGCITDLHIHDVDLIRYLFGEPDSVSCTASTSVCLYDTVHTTFSYGGVPITAIGDWTLTGMKFKANGRIDFDRATLVFDGEKLTVYPKDKGESYVALSENESMYYRELKYFCDVLMGKTENVKNPPESAAESVRLVELMRESASRNGEKISV